MSRSAVSFYRAGGLMLVLALAGCAKTTLQVDQAKVISPAEEAVGGHEEAVSSSYKIGKPYRIGGVWYYPAVDYEYVETGVASWYGPGFDGKSTANGERYDMNSLTAAHRTLPLPSIVRVTNLENGRALTLRVNDRGPFAHGRIIDVSRRAAQLLGFELQGTAKVRVEIMPEESLALAMGQSGGQYATALSEETAPRAAPAIAVASEVLPPPGATAAPTASESPEPLQPPDQPPEMTDEPLAPTQVYAFSSVQPDTRITIQPVRPTQLFVQAGSFVNYQNAYRLSALLSSLGQSEVSPTFVGGQQFFRVRLGPIGSVDEADRMLERVIGAGHSDARIVVQ